MYAHRFFDFESCDNLLSQILREYRCFSYMKCSKILIITLSEYLNLVSQQFINSKIVQIFDCLITLLEISNVKKDLIFNGADLSAEEIHFSKLMKLVINNIYHLDQFEYFKNQVKKLKNNYPQIYQMTYNNLLETKKSYFKNIMCSAKVGDEARIILKIQK